MKNKNKKNQMSMSLNSLFDDAAAEAFTAGLRTQDFFYGVAT